MKKKSYYRLIADKFLEKFLNRVGLAIVILMFGVAFLSTIIANNKPYYFVDQGHWTFPILEDFPIIGSHFHYPEYKETNFRKLALNPSAHLLLPPIPYSPTEYDLDSTISGPSPTHLMGTDEQGRDIAARMVYGAKVSLSVGFVAVGIYVFLGVIMGALAGFFGGWIDILISRIIEIVMCFPTFFLILTVLAFVGVNENLLSIFFRRAVHLEFVAQAIDSVAVFLEPSVFNIMLVIGITGWTGIARLVRGEFLKLKNQDFVQSARVLGYSTPRIIFRHILPNALSPVLVSVTFGIASAILAESALSFLGFGVQPPTPSWGSILSQSREFMDIAWWMMAYPGVAIFVAVTAFNLVGEGLQDAIDPRS